MKLHRESFKRLQELFENTEIRTLTESDRYVILSDFHMGNGTKVDDIKNNGTLLIRVLEEYFEKGYHLILNGDVEELQRFPLNDIQAAWPEIYILFQAFYDQGRLTKIFGNHDLTLIHEKNQPFPISESLRFDYKGNQIFIFHGHQTIRRYYEESQIITFLLRYILTPLGIKNYSVSHSSSKKFTTEKRIYQFSSLQGIMSIVGHTHRPLFESMSKNDVLRFNVERLCREYPQAPEEKQEEIKKQISLLKEELARVLNKENAFVNRRSLYDSHFVVPCLFNSGAAIGKRGLTNIVIENGNISLVHWFERHRMKSYRNTIPNNAEQLGKSTIYSVEMKKDSLDYIFSRIHLLGGSNLYPGKSVNINDKEDLSSAV